MKSIATVVALGSTLAIATFSAGATEAFPDRPVRIVVPSVAGGALDIVARLTAVKLGELLGQPVYIENKPGAGGGLGVRMVKDARPDGYTLLVQTNSLTSLPSFTLNPGFDPKTDLHPVAGIAQSPNIMAIGASQEIKSIPEFVKAAKTETLTYASAGLGSPLHINGAMFADIHGIKMLHIPYKGSALAYPDVASGRVTVTFGGFAGLLPFVRSGKMRALAVTGASRMKDLPEVPTLSEQGVPMVYAFWIGLLAPANTPSAVIRKLENAIREIQGQKEFKAALEREGAEPWQLDSTQFRRHINAELVQTEKLAQKLGVQKE